MKKPDKHPYCEFEGTREWATIDRAIMDLVANKDIEEYHGWVWSHRWDYLDKALATVNQVISKVSVTIAYIQRIYVRK